MAAMEERLLTIAERDLQADGADRNAWSLIVAAGR
jgi:hypothetical protein